MESNLKLQTLLENLLGSRNVYFQPPESVKLKYDAIIYRRRSIDNTYANNLVYKQDDAWELTVIYRDPNCEIPRKISQLPRCRFDRHFVVDGLYHDVFILYHN